MFWLPAGYGSDMEDNVAPPSSLGDESAVSVLEEFADAGWTVDHLVRSSGEIECGRCNEVVSADRWLIGAQHRIEGASDPDDMQLAVGLACPQCEARGAIVIGYGPMASENDSDVMLRLDLDDVADPIAAST